MNTVGCAGNRQLAMNWWLELTQAFTSGSPAPAWVAVRETQSFSTHAIVRYDESAASASWLSTQLTQKGVQWAAAHSGFT